MIVTASVPIPTRKGAPSCIRAAIARLNGTCSILGILFFVDGENTACLVNQRSTDLTYFFFVCHNKRMQHEKHRILAIENAEGRRRTDLRRDYNRLAAGAKAIRRSLSALNERRIFHATHTRVITGRIVDGKIVSDAFTTNPGMLQSYKTTKVAHPLAAWETSGSVVWIPTNDNTVYASPSQFCVANWKKEGIARACNGWRDATTIWWPSFESNSPVFMALRDVYVLLPNPAAVKKKKKPVPKKKKKPLPKKKKKFLSKKKKKPLPKTKKIWGDNQYKAKGGATLWDMRTTVKPGDVFLYDPPEKIWRHMIKSWKDKLQKMGSKYIQSHIKNIESKHKQASVDLLDKLHRKGMEVEVTFLAMTSSTSPNHRGIATGALTQDGCGFTRCAIVELEGGMRIKAARKYCYLVKKSPIDRAAVRRGDKFKYINKKQRTWGVHSKQYRDRKASKPNNVVVTYLRHNQGVPPVNIRFPNGTQFWVDWEDLAPLPPPAPAPVIAPPPAWTTEQVAHANVRDTHAFNRAGNNGGWTEGRRPSKAWMKRVMKDFKFLQKPGTLPKGQAFVVFDDEKLHLLKFMLVPSAPYDGGFFEFDLCIPPDYPARPPLVLIVTTGQGRVRKGNEFPNLGPLSVSGFNPNLYHGGKVCLSILGTFSGPGWDPAVGSIYQVIVSILGLIFGTDCPMKNEPGYHATPAQCRAYIRDLRRAIAKYASVVPSTFAPFVQPTGSASTHPFLRRFLQ